MGQSSQHTANGLRQLLSHAVKPSQPLGLRGVVCGRTTLIGPTNESVSYCGIDLRDGLIDLPFESLGQLLFHQRMPSPDSEADLACILNDARAIDSPIADAIAAIPLQTRTLDVLPVAISLLSCFDVAPSDDRNQDGVLLRFWRLLAQLPGLIHVALGGPLKQGVPEILPEDLNDFASQLLMIVRSDCIPPSAAEVSAFRKVLICQCLTTLRPAGFSARLIGSQSPNLVAAVQSAATMFASQLRNDPFAWVAENLSSFESPDAAGDWLQARRTRGVDMPFGFASETDPRAVLLMEECENLLGNFENIVLEASARRLETLLASDNLFPTVDWAAARALTLLNVPSDRISLVIGIARLVGWAAEAFEQHKSGVSLLPNLRYADSK